MKLTLKKRKAKVMLSSLIPRDTFKYKDDGDDSYCHLMVLESNPNLRVTTMNGEMINNSVNTDKVLTVMFGNGSVGCVKGSQMVIQTDTEVVIHG